MNELLNWNRQAAGQYISGDGKIEIRKVNTRWYVFVEGQEWGGDYAPFGSLTDAKVLLDEYRWRGFV